MSRRNVLPSAPFGPFALSTDELRNGETSCYGRWSIGAAEVKMTSKQSEPLLFFFKAEILKQLSDCVTAESCAAAMLSIGGKLLPRWKVPAPSNLPDQPASVIKAYDPVFADLESPAVA